jgi:dihydrofolate reductase
MNHETPEKPRLIAIAAMASNRVIGRDGKLPWHLPEDLKFFKQTTLGHPVLMGRKTFDSIVERLGKPLPGRTNIVLSKSIPLRDDAQVIRNIVELQSPISNLSSPTFLIGGAQLYESLLPECDELLLTYLSAPHQGDAYFPPFEDMFELHSVLAGGEGWEIRRYVKKTVAAPPIEE